jgi:MFS family permease
VEESSLAGGILTVVSIAVLANFISGYNAGQAVVGMPNIARDLNADVWGLVWIIQGFMLGSTFVQLVVGRLADIYGRVRLFNIGLLIFTLSAFASGMSSGPYIFALSRFAQGVGEAFLMSLSLTSSPP